MRELSSDSGCVDGRTERTGRDGRIVRQTIRGRGSRGGGVGEAVLREHGVAEADVDRVWEAIALHSSIGLAERRGLLTYLTYKGVFVDVGRLADAVADGVRQEVLNAYPKPPEGSHIADAIVAHAKRSPAAAPPVSLAAYLLLQQREREHPPG